LRITEYNQLHSLPQTSFLYIQLTFIIYFPFFIFYSCSNKTVFSKHYWMGIIKKFWNKYGRTRCRRAIRTLYNWLHSSSFL